MIRVSRSTREGEFLQEGESAVFKFCLYPIVLKDVEVIVVEELVSVRDEDDVVEVLVVDVL